MKENARALHNGILPYASAHVRSYSLRTYVPPAALHDPLADHLPAQRAVVLVIALDDGVDLVLGVGLSDLKRARDFLQTDAPLLALGGDVGCSGGPTLVGLVSSALNDNLKSGILAGVLFPLLLLIAILSVRKLSRRARP